MVGCMVSSSLAIAPAFAAAQLADYWDLDGFLSLSEDRLPENESRARHDQSARRALVLEDLVSYQGQVLVV
jgi:hypothetical protein